MKDDELEDDGIISVYALPRKIVGPLPLLPQPPPLSGGNSVGEMVEHSAENTLDLSLDTSAEESVRLPMRHSVRETNKLPAETCMSTHSVSTSDEIDQSIHPRTNFRDQLIARLARERELLAKRNEDAAHIAAQCIPNADFFAPA